MPTPPLTTLTYWHNKTGPITLPVSEVQHKFAQWLRQKDKVYLSYYKWVLVGNFITDTLGNGLSGTVTDIELNHFENVLMNIAYEYKKVLKIDKLKSLHK
jgi:hypothetical protein